MALSDSSSLSSLSPPPPSDGEKEPPKPSVKPKTVKLRAGKLVAASRDASPLSPPPEPTPPAREPTPPHEYVLADNPDIAFLVMFRSRFSGLFPKNVPNLGPHDIESGLVGSTPSEQIENLLCALLGLVLNRKKYVERGHHGRALEEAISTQRHQWPRAWGGSNPLPGTRTFSDMDPTERLILLKTLVLWSLNASEAVSNILKESYKQNRHDDDLNQPLSVQPWGSDGRKRRYWLIEGQNDTSFRLYIERAPKTNNRTWWSVAGNLDELRAVGEELRAENSQAGRRLADSINAAIPRLEDTVEKRKRKEYRQARRAQFQRPEPGFSLYEGRTRGKRMKYTFSDDEDASDSNSARRSTRQSNRSSPGATAGPTVTASGRQVRSRFGRSYGELTQTSSNTEISRQPENTNHMSGRPRRSGGYDGRQNRGTGTNTDEDMSADDDEAASSGEEWDGDEEDVEGKLDADEDEQHSDDTSDDSMMDTRESLIVTLKYGQCASTGFKQDREINGISGTRPESAHGSKSPSKGTQQNASVPSFVQSSSSPNLESSPSMVDPKDSVILETVKPWQPGSLSAYAYQPPSARVAPKPQNRIATQPSDEATLPKQSDLAQSTGNSATSSIQSNQTPQDEVMVPIRAGQQATPQTTVIPSDHLHLNSGTMNGYTKEEVPKARSLADVAEEPMEPMIPLKKGMSSLHSPHAAQTNDDYAQWEKNEGSTYPVPHQSGHQSGQAPVSN